MSLESQRPSDSAGVPRNTVRENRLAIHIVGVVDDASRARIRDGAASCLMLAVAYRGGRPGDHDAR